MRTEIEIRDAERRAISYVIEQTEKSWEDVLKKAEENDKRIAVARIKGMFDAWAEMKAMLERRKSLCENPKNLKEEWDFWNAVKDAKPSPLTGKSEEKKHG